MRYFLLFINVFIYSGNLLSQSGCTDPKAQNYNASATINDGSCTYPTTSVSLTNAKTLASPTLDESSGVIYTDGALWTHNDSGNPPAIYRIDESNGSILQTVNVTNATNVDWEDITADDNYFYVGDFGNNSNGIRTDLKVYRISKSDITAAATVNVTAGIINFSYSDQVIGASPGSNNTQFDCEAFFVKNGVLHLFTKDWVNGHTKHYELSAIPGTYSISEAESFLNVNGLITSADISDDNQVVLVGYEDGGTGIFMYLLYDFSADSYFSGNKRRLELGDLIDFGNVANSKGQVEAVTFSSGGNGYISSERVNASIPARLYSFTVANLLSLPVDLLSFTASYQDPEVVLNWQTASEINSSHFSIEKSGDAVNFNEIGRKQAAGQSNSIIYYRYTDWKPLPGSNYYRLKQVDINGTGKIHDIRTVRLPHSNTRLKAFAGGSSLNILTMAVGTGDFKNTSYRLVGINGSELKRGGIHSSVQSVDIATLSKGTYILMLSNGEHVKFQKR